MLLAIMPQTYTNFHTYFRTLASGKKALQHHIPSIAPIVVLDDRGFSNFCSQIGITPSLDGAIVLNQIWDSRNSNFRYKEYAPFVREHNQKTILYKNDKTVEIPVLSYTQKSPALREEYDNYALVHFIPLSMWNKTLGEVCEAESDSYICIFSNGTANLTDLGGKRLLQCDLNETLRNNTLI